MAGIVGTLIYPGLPQIVGGYVQIDEIRGGPLYGQWQVNVSYYTSHDDAVLNCKPPIPIPDPSYLHFTMPYTAGHDPVADALAMLQTKILNVTQVVQ